MRLGLPHFSFAGDRALNPMGLNTDTVYSPIFLTLMGESGEVKQKFGAGIDQLFPLSVEKDWY